MQGKLQNHIQQLMKDHKRRRIWKRVTAMMSVIVLLGTLVSLRNFAIAVTEEKAQEAQITEAVETALLNTASAKDAGIAVVASEFTPDEVGDNSNLPLEGELTDEVSGSDAAPVTEGTVPQSPESGDRGDSPAVTSTATTTEVVNAAPEAINTELPLEGRSTSGGRWSSADRSGAETVSAEPTDEVSSVTGVESADLITDIVDDPAPLAAAATNSLPLEGAQGPGDLGSAPTGAERRQVAAQLPEGVSMLRMAPAATLLGAPASPKAAPAQITSAIPTRIRVTQNGNPVGTVLQNSQLEVEIAWRVNDSTQIQTAGDYIVMQLPSQFTFPQGDGQYRLANNERVTTTGEIIPAGTSLADYRVSGNTLTLTFTEAGVKLNAAGQLSTPALMGAFQWSSIQFSNVEINTSGTFTPVFTINGTSVSNARQVTVLPAVAGRLSGATIDSFRINGYEGGRTNSWGTPSYVTVGREDPVTLNITWSWESANRFIINGDYIEIELPSGLSYNHLDDTSVATQGSLIRTQTINNNGRWTARITFQDVATYHNEAAGRLQVTGYLLNPTSGNMTLTATPVNGTGKSGTITVNADTGSVTPGTPGTWYVRRGIKYVGGHPNVNTVFDIYLGDDTTWPLAAPDEDGNITGMQVGMFVVSQSRSDTPSPDPFRNQDTVEYDPRKYPNINYVAAFCADSKALAPGVDTRYYRDNIDRMSFTAEQKNKLKGAMAHTYPYVSLEQMRSDLGLPNLSEAEAVTAGQMVVWSVLNGRTSINNDETYFNRTQKQRIQDAYDKLMSYGATSSGTPTGTLSFVSGPSISFNGTTATVSGRLNTASGVTGTLTVNGRSTGVNILSDGSFTVSVTGVSKTDRFDLAFNGTSAGGVTVWYYSNQTNKMQNLISAEVTSVPVKLTWCYEGQEDVKRKIRVVKEWQDKDGNPLTTTPNAEVEITLYRQALADPSRNLQAGTVETVATVKLNRTNGFTASWNDLPVTDAQGRTYHYWARETLVPAGYEFVEIRTGTDGDVLVLTAENKEKDEEKTKASVIKKWENLQPGTIKLRSHVKLLKTNAADTYRQELYVKLDGQPVKNASGDIVYGADYDTTQQNGYVLCAWTLDETNGYKVTFEGLPKYESDGKTLARYVFFEDWFEVERNGDTIHYNVSSDGKTYVAADGSEGNFTVAVEQPDMSDADNGKTPAATVVNTETPDTTEVRIIKDWKGVPDSLKKNYKAVVGLFFQIDNGLNGGIGFKNNVMIKDRKDTVTASGLEITGSYKLDTTSYPPIERDGYRYAVVELTAGNNWTATFKNLPKYGADGKPVQYMMRELRVEDENGQDVTEDFAIGYDSSAPGYTYGDGNYYVYFNNAEELPTVTVTNTKHGALTVKKKWVNADGLTEWSEVLPGGIKVELSAKRNGQEIPANQLAQILGAPTTVELNAGNGWSYTWDYVYTTNMKYFVKEVGFVRGNADRYVRIDEDGTPISYDKPVQVEYDKDQKIFKICLVNKRKPVEVELIKEDKLSDRKLEGATFKLFDWNGNQVLNPTEKDGLFRTDANGKVKIGDPNGLHLMISQKTLGEDYIYRYVLVEVDPPAGYIKRQNPLTVTFHVEISNGNPVLVIDKVDDASAAAGLVSADDRQLKLHIRNEQTEFTLPETGGIGTRGYTAGGLMLICMAALLYIVTNQHITKLFHTNRFVKK